MENDVCSFLDFFKKYAFSLPLHYVYAILIRIAVGHEVNYGDMAADQDWGHYAPFPFCLTLQRCQVESWCNFKALTLLWLYAVELSLKEKYQRSGN